MSIIKNSDIDPPGVIWNKNLHRIDQYRYNRLPSKIRRNKDFLSIQKYCKSDKEKYGFIK